LNRRQLSGEERKIAAVDQDPLALTPDEMRALGYRAVDLLVERLSSWSEPPVRRADPTVLRRLLAEPAPEEPRGAGALERLFEEVTPYLARVDHPRFLAFIPSSGTWPGALGDLVASALDVYAASWAEGAGPAQLELTVLDWFKQWVGLPSDADGVLTTGGSQANLQALACARELRAGAMRDDLILYVPDQSHSSIARAARVLGFRPGQVRVLPTDRSFRLRPETLATALDVDLARGLTPVAAVANAGSTSTGAVDPLAELAEIARTRSTWLHVDAAYGGFATLTERGRRALAGVEFADSVTMDPHKLLYQPFECGALLVREPDALRRAFEVIPPYLRDTRVGDGEVNFGDRGIQLTRTTRAFKVWLSIQTLGLRAFRAAVDRSLDLAEHAARSVEASPELELTAPPMLGIVCFRRRFPEEPEAEWARLNARLAADLEASGVGFVSSTTLRGRYTLRICPLNHTTRQEHVDQILDFLSTSSVGSGAAPEARSARFDDVRDAWLATAAASGEGKVEPAELASLALFADVPSDGLERLAHLAVWREATAGTTLVRQWDATRDFCILLTGAIEVSRDGEPLLRAGPGEFFGELAALDWGRGYGYARTATVIATTSVRLLVFREGTLEAAMSIAPTLARAVEQAVDVRLPT
jgi:glutamate/tyrosine decarboxylase-like PLP-dependent enzyme